MIILGNNDLRKSDHCATRTIFHLILQKINYSVAFHIISTAIILLQPHQNFQISAINFYYIFLSMFFLICLKTSYRTNVNLFVFRNILLLFLLLLFNFFVYIYWSFSEQILKFVWQKLFLPTYFII